MAMDRDRMQKRLLATFLEELGDNVVALNRDLLAFEKAAGAQERAESLKALFRTAHSLKGAARSANVGPIERACHALESLLARAQAGQTALGREVFAVLFAAADALEEAGMRLREQQNLSGSPLELLLPRLESVANGDAPPPAPADGHVRNPPDDRLQVWHLGRVDMDPERCWQAVEAGDPRFDGWIYCAVTSTGIYCRPSCPARTPKRENVRFFATAAAAQAAGFRACKRCRPDATPGSPEWDRRADLVGRAMRLIADGVVDRDGVGGLASRLGYTARHVHRELVAVAGAGPLALARAQRSQTARILLETTDVSIAEVAFAAGFQSVRQFNATLQEVFATTPGQLRAGAQRRGRPVASGPIVLRLPYRAPLDGDGLISFLARRAIPGVEEVVDGAYRRSLRLPEGAGTVELTPGDGHVLARFWLDSLVDLAAAMQRCRALFDLDSDPVAVLEALGHDPLVGPSVTATPGRRVPGTVDGHELAVRAVLGQQVSLFSAAALAGRLVVDYGEPLERPLGGVTHLFPSSGAIAGAAAADLAMPDGRRRCLIGLSRALAAGEVVIDAGADRDDALRSLQALPGIGPWTLNYIAMRALRDPDAYLPTDLGIRRALERKAQDAAQAVQLAERWRPYRAYASQHLWASLADGTGPAATTGPHPARSAA